MDRQPEYLADVVRELRRLPRETEWVEFKVNAANPSDIGEYISALSNAAALTGKAAAWLLWGVSDDTHDLVGTTFRPGAKKVGNEDLENWLLHLLEPKISFRFHELAVEGRPIVMLEIERARGQPVRFRGQEFIRIGSHKRPLKHFPEKERSLWRVFDQTLFEDHIAVESVHDHEVLRLVDYPVYFEMLDMPLPEMRGGILDRLANDRLIHRCAAGRWNVTNLALLLFARDLEDFRNLRRKVLRVIQYRGTGRTEAARERREVKGYASGFAGAMQFINGLLPANETIGEALRQAVPAFPEPAVRELIANALIHQDFTITGAGPMVEIFDDRIEVTNPGLPLVDTLRFVDTSPRSRNESLASLMRRIGICEERGSGWDRIAGASGRSVRRPHASGPVRTASAAEDGPRRPCESRLSARLPEICEPRICQQHIGAKTLRNRKPEQRKGLKADRRSD